MKNIKSIFVTAAISAALLWSFSIGALESLGGRQLKTNLQAKMADEGGMAYDGSVNIEASFYNAKIRDVANFVYRESFDNVKVEHGIFRVPLFAGKPLEGSGSVQELSKHSELFVDIKINGKLFMELEPVDSSLFSIRSESAKKTLYVRNPKKLSESDIPPHSAGLITTGKVSESYIPSMAAAKVSSGTFGLDQVPDLSAGAITSGAKFPANVIPGDLNASDFSGGVLPSSVIPPEAERKGDIWIERGELPSAAAVPIGPGFSRSQCNWVVGIRQIDGYDGIDQFSLSTDGNGVVDCKWSPADGNYDVTNPVMKCVANYLVICRR